MFFNGDIKFKGISSSTYSLIITAVPSINHSEIRGEVFTIPGRDGDLLSNDPYRGDAEVRVQFAMVNNNGTSGYQTALREVRKWLAGTGKLIIGDSLDSYYEVKKVVIATDSRVIINYGVLEVVFTIYPYEFLASGDTSITSYATIDNDADKALPIYEITGEGSGVLTVNGKDMEYEVSNKLTIDCRRQIAVETSSGGTVTNASGSINGNYEDLCLVAGENTVEITGGTTLKVYPKWGYVI
jgi:phage-related protein